MSWTSLGSIELNISGQFRPLDFGLEPGRVYVRVPAFAQANEALTYTIGIYSGTAGSEGYIDSAVCKIVDFERFLKFEVPPGLDSVLLGMRLNQEGPAYTTAPSWWFVGGGDSGGGGGGEPLALTLEDFLPQVPYCFEIKRPEIDRPSTVIRHGGEYWVFNFLLSPVRFSLAWEFLGLIPVSMGKPTPDNEAIDRVWDVALDEQSDRIYISCFSRHVVRCFRLSTLVSSPELIADLPVPPSGASWQFSSSSRSFEDGYIRNACGVAVLPNGNVAIASRLGVSSGKPDENLGAIVEYSPDGAYVQTLVSRVGAGGLAQEASYQDWFGKIRWQEGHLWACSFRQRMLVRFEVNTNADVVTSVLETYRQFSKPGGLEAAAAWTPHGLLVSGNEILTTHNSFNGSDPGLYRGVYRQSEAAGAVQWSLGQWRAMGEQTWGNHPSMFSNPHDVLDTGVIADKQTLAVCDFGESKISILPRPERMNGALPAVEVELLRTPDDTGFLRIFGIEANAGSDRAFVPIFRLRPS